ncbi:MAG: helix-turn-helix transcriptional regulator [Alphaproteobacteria bacterium]|nr:helix-turn-helix transcriptional regulator [Alphaproteobacteria bacterium]
MPRQIEAGGISATLLPRAAYDVAYTPDRTVAGFAFDIQTGTHAFASDRVRPFITVPGSLALTPRGCDIKSRSDTGGEYLTVSVMPGREKQVAGDAAIGRPERYSNAAHGFAGKWARALRASLLRPCADQAEVESFAALLYEAAWQARLPSGKPATSITTRRLRLLNELVEERLSGELTVADMAKAVGLSTSFFIRAFAAATGTTPHGYLMERRLEKVRYALALRDTKIADVALSCGFSSQAHMTAAFSRQFGISPKRFQQMVA